MGCHGMVPTRARLWVRDAEGAFVSFLFFSASLASTFPLKAPPVYILRQKSAHAAHFLLRISII